MTSGMIYPDNPISGSMQTSRGLGVGCRTSPCTAGGSPIDLSASGVALLAVVFVEQVCGVDNVVLSNPPVGNSDGTADVYMTHTECNSVPAGNYVVSIQCRPVTDGDLQEIGRVSLVVGLD